MSLFAASPRSLGPEAEVLRLRAYAEKLRKKIQMFRDDGRSEWWIKDLESSLKFTLALLHGAEERVKATAAA